MQSAPVEAWRQPAKFSATTKSTHIVLIRLTIIVYNHPDLPTFQARTPLKPNFSGSHPNPATNL
jgi:hypothetical protein